MKIKAYLHSTKEKMGDLGEENGLKGDALENFCWALNEVELTLDVDKNTGDYTITHVDGVPLRK